MPYQHQPVPPPEQARLIAKRHLARFLPIQTLLPVVLIGFAVPANRIQAGLVACGDSDPQDAAQTAGTNPGVSPQNEKDQQDEDLLHQAEADFKSGQTEEALQRCTQAIGRYPKSSKAYYLLGIIQDRRGARQEARQALLHSSQLDPSSVEPHIYLGRMSYQSRQLDAAAGEFRLAIHLGDNASASAHYGLGLVLLGQSKYEEALPDLKAAVEARPVEGARLYSLAECEIQLGLLDDVRALKQAQSLPEGRGQVPNERYATAISYLEKALETSPPEDLSRKLQFALAVAYSHVGRYSEAATAYQKLLVSQPESFLLHFNLGTVYAHLLRYTEAVPEYQKALEINPNDDNTRLALAEVYESYGQFPLAIPYLQDSIRNKPSDINAHELLGRAYRMQGRYSEAVEVLRKAAQLDPTRYDIHYDLGLSLERLGDTDEAVKQLQEATRLKPDASDAVYELGLLQMKTNEKQAARGELKQFEQLRRQGDERMRAGVLNNQGNEFLEKGQVSEAASAYQEAAKLDPQSAPYRYNLSVALAKLGDYAGEQRELEGAVEIDPRFAKAHNQLGLSYMAQGRSADAEREFKKALDINPQYAEAENNFGVLYTRQGRNLEATRLFQKASEDDPQYPDAFIDLGLALADDGKFDAARHELEKALAISPDNPRAYTALGAIAEKTGSEEKAVQYLKKVAELQPSSLEAHLNLGAALADQFDLSGALQEFTAGTHLAPTSAVAFYDKGRALYDLGKLAEARTELATACRLSADDPSAIYLLALTEEQRGDLSHSSALLKRLVQLDPHQYDAQYMLGRVLLRMGKTADAIERWRVAVDTNPKDLRTLHELTDLLSKTGNSEASVYSGRCEELEKKQQLTDPVLQLDYLGLVAAQARDWPQAVAQIKEAVDLCQGCAQSARLHRDLGLTYCRQGKLEGGEGELRTALTRNPKDAATLRALRALETLRTRQRTGP